MLESEKKYIVESKVDEWEDRFTRWIARKYWSRKVKNMREGQILKLYRELVEENRPLSWLNGGDM